MTQAALSRDDYRSIRTVIRFAESGILPAAEVAERAAEMLSAHRSGVTEAMQVIERIRAGVLPSQDACGHAENQLKELYEASEDDGHQDRLSNVA